MKDGGKDIPRGLLAYKPEATRPPFTNVPTEKWSETRFVPLADGSGKDRFGNRIHYSPDFAYLDRTDGVVRAGLLLSPEGQTLIRSMPGCLSQLNSAIKQIVEDGQREAQFKHGTLSDTSKSGSQSKIYIWETPHSEKYIIKKPAVSGKDFLSRRNQSYINEMLQTQEIGESLVSLSNEVKIGLSTFLFASAGISCTKFVEGHHPENWTGDQYERIATFARGVSGYILDTRHTHDGIFREAVTDLEATKTVPIEKNVIVCADGSMIWIDPFRTI